MAKLTLAAVGLLIFSSSQLLSGCESCRFSLGGRLILVSVRYPVGMVVEAEVCDENNNCSPLKPNSSHRGLSEFQASFSAQEDGLGCRLTGGSVTVFGEGCTPFSTTLESISFDEFQDGGRKRNHSVERILQCDPTALDPEVGRACADDAVCGGDGYFCHPSKELCVPTECASDEECSPLQCDEANASCF